MLRRNVNPTNTTEIRSGIKDLKAAAIMIMFSHLQPPCGARDANYIVAQSCTPIHSPLLDEMQKYIRSYSVLERLLSNAQIQKKCELSLQQSIDFTPIVLFSPPVE